MKILSSKALNKGGTLFKISTLLTPSNNRTELESVSASNRYRDNDGKVPVERPGHKCPRESADVGVASEAVRWKPLEAVSEEDGGRQRDANQIHQVQTTS